jgi:glycosyltransferase involved in cell wall biosynthesis
MGETVKEHQVRGDLRNRAMAACSHDWIFSLDSDERIPYKNFEELLHKANRYSSLGAQKLYKYAKLTEKQRGWRYNPERMDD